MRLLWHAATTMLILNQRFSKLKGGGLVRRIKYTAVLMLILIIALIAAYSYFLPESIAIRKGGEETIGFLLPFDISVSGDKEVLSIKNAPVTQNINISPHKAVICGNEQGSAELMLSLLGVPVKKVELNVLPDGEFVPSGETVGIVIETDGVLVLGTGSVKTASGDKAEPCRGILRSGDLIKSINGVEVHTKEELAAAVGKCADRCEIRIDRLEKPVIIAPVISEEGVPMLGLWVRDSTQGIGTVTYYNKKDMSFGALGHPVTDVDTGQIMKISGGSVYSASIDGIVKGEKGRAGELTGAGTSEIIGTADKNCNTGIYGRLNVNGADRLKGKACPIALKSSVKCGAAKILADIDGNGVKEYDIEIEAINNLGKNTSKGMIIRITDEKLIDRTGGIVQGMSGSPILQNGCLVGAVTHVFVQDPKRGYGIFIENMLCEN